MKLIRLTTLSQDGRFDNEFNDEIVIEPQSKIALQSIAVKTDITDLTIMGANDSIDFEITSGNTRTIALTHGDFNEHNNHLFLNNLQLNLNQGLQYTDNQSGTKFRDEIGLQIQAKPVNGKVNITMANTGYTYTTSNLGLTFKENVSAQVNFTGNPVKIASASPSGAGRVDDKHGISSIFPFTTGCGVFRIKLSTWQNDGSGDNNAAAGFEFGLCDSKPDTWSLPHIPENKKTFAIKGAQPTNPYFFKTSNLGSFTSLGITPAVTSGNNADILEISIQSNRIVGKLFRSSQSAADPIFSVPYEVDSSNTPIPLFGYLSFRGTKANIEIIDMKFTSDAFLNPREITTGEPHDETSLGSGARPLAPRNSNTTKKINFKSIEVAEYLGFKNTLHEKTGLTVLFQADRLFLALVENDCFIILLENLQIESYDGFKKGRKSILASVPNPTNGDRVIYEPNNLNYVELKNANKISLRNLRATILYQDYTPIKTVGFSVLNVLVN